MPHAPAGARTALRRLVLVAMLGAAYVLATATAGQTAPAAPGVIKEFPQLGAGSIELQLWGDEFYNGWETLDGHTVVRAASGRWEYAVRGAGGDLVASGIPAHLDLAPVEAHLRPAGKVIDAARAAMGAPPAGVPFALAPPPWAGANTDVLFLMAEFNDVGCSFTPNQMQQNMFGGTATGPGNMEDYYDEISNGMLDIDGDVVGDAAGTDCVALANSKQHYDTGPGNDDTLVNELVAAVDGHVDFSQYDNDGNGVVDALGVIYAGGGPHDGCDTDNGADGGDGDALWPHSGGTGGTATADGVTIDPFIINSEVTTDASFGPCDEIQTIGLFAHEFGHSLGLPDLYDTDGSSEGVGSWSAMASQYLSTVNLADTPPHFDPWSKWWLGWINPTNATALDGAVFLDQVETTQEVLRFRDNPGGAERGGTGEYFLVENRQQVGFDAQLPGCGTLIWHMEESQTNNRNEGHSAASHRLVDVEEADGLDELDIVQSPGDRGDAGDPFPGSTNNRLFTDATDPHGRLYDGTNTGIRVRFNSGCQSAMQLSVGPNDVPAASIGGPYVTPEGTDVTLNASASSDPDLDPLTYAWDLDNDGSFDDGSGATRPFTAVGQDGAFTVRVQVSDPDGATSIASTTVTVTNVAPSVSAMSDAPKDEGSVVTIEGTISDPGWLDPLTATIDWADGSGAVPLAGAIENTRPNATLSFSVGHRYGDNGVYPVEICGSDDDTSTCASVPLQIDNVAPTVTLDPAQVTAILEGATVDVAATFSDPGWLDTYTARIAWGHADLGIDVFNPAALTTDSAGPGPDLGSVTGSKQVGDDGLFPVSISVRDDDAGTGADGFTLDTSNVDPTAVIDVSGAADVNGVQTILGEAGAPVDFAADSEDPGSDDLLLSWDFDDGTPLVLVTSLVNPPLPDLDPSPTVQMRAVNDMRTHTFVEACLYEPTFASDDDDLGHGDDAVAVLIQGNADRSRPTGWWHKQYKPKAGASTDFPESTLACYLKIARFASDVFEEERALSSFDDAHAIWHKDDALATPQEKLDKELLTAWLNFANGAFAWDQLVVDTDRDGVADLAFADAVAAAEATRLDPAATKHATADQEKVLAEFNKHKDA